MKRRDVLAGAAAVAVASVIPTLPAIAMPVAKPVAEKKFFVLFTTLDHGYALMRTFEADSETKKGISLIKSQWSDYHLIKETADPDIPVRANLQVGDICARIVKRTPEQMKKLWAQAIPCDNNTAKALKIARTLKLNEMCSVW